MTAARRESGAARRVGRLRAASPAAADLALACALAVRVEPDLLRRLRLLLPGADAAAEADLWFSGLLAGRDATAIALDQPVAEVLRAELRDADRAALREAAWALISTAHAGAHWSVRLEERINYLDTARPDGAAAEIDDLLLAPMDRLTTGTDQLGIARWLRGSHGRQPTAVQGLVTARAAAAAAALHLDRQAPADGLLSAGETQTWLPWLSQALPRVAVPVRLLDGAVVLGRGGEDAIDLPDVPDTDPRVIEVRWNDGAGDRGRLVRFRPGESVQVETGTGTVTLITLAGAAYRLEPADGPDLPPAGLRFDHLKAALRPCLAREAELSRLRSALADPAYDRIWIGIVGRPGRGSSTMLVAALDELAARGQAVVEHFFTLTGGVPDDPAVVERSCLAQLDAQYPDDTVWDANGLEAALDALAELGAFWERPLVIALDGLPGGYPYGPPFPRTPPAGVRYLFSGQDEVVRPPAEYRGTPEQFAVDMRSRTVLVGDDVEADREVCLALAARDADAIASAVGASVDGAMLVDLVDDLPRVMVRLLGWLRRQPPGSVRRVPAVLTARWPGVRAGLAERFPGLEVLLDIVLAADGVNTWQDCADAADASPDVAGRPDFWDTCVAESLVVDVPPDGLVRITDPAVAEVLGAAGLAGHRLLGMRHDDLAEFVRTASPTRLAAAVGHALAAGDLAEARVLCTDLAVLRRRYAEGAAGLLADLAAVAAAEEATVPAGAGALRTLHGAVRALAERQVPPADLATALHDRLAEYAALHVVPGLADDPAALAPLRVRAVVDEPDLRASTYLHTQPGPVLALAGFRADPEDRGLVLPAGPAALYGTLAGRSDEPWRGAVGGPGGYAAWSDTRLYVDLSPAAAATLSGRAETAAGERGVPVPVGPLGGRIGQVFRLADGAAVATTDGAVTLWEPSGQGWRSRALVGHGAPVTAMATLAGATLTASEDGTVRAWYPSGAVSVFTGHRGAVRCLAVTGPGTWVTGGDDGCLLSWLLEAPGGPQRRWHGHDGPVTCLAAFPDGEQVMSGGTDGRVAVWSPRTARVLGDHEEPVCGITLADNDLIASWGQMIRFWVYGGTPRLAAAVGRFPGGVRDLVAGELTYTVLCGDGSAQRRLLPGADATAEHLERACLAVADGTVYLGLNRLLCAYRPDAPIRAVADRPAGFVQAATAGPDTVVVREPDGTVTLLTVSDHPAQTAYPEQTYSESPMSESASSSDDPPAGNVTGNLGASNSGAGAIPIGSGGGDLIAADPRGEVAVATAREASTVDLRGTSNTQVRLSAPADITCLSVTPRVVLLAGLANGETHGASTAAERVRVLTGDGSAVTALARLDDGTVVTGSAAGTVRWWPPDADHGPTDGPRHAGAVTAVVAVPPWVVTAGQDGRIALWDPATARLVHEIHLGAPVLALAAEPGLATARDARGRLWTFTLDGPTDRQPTLTATADVQLSDRTVTVVLMDAGTRPEYEVTAIRLRANDQPVRLDTYQRWPAIGAEGTFVVPWRPEPGVPFGLRGALPETAARSIELRLEADLVSRTIRGYRVTQRIPIGPGPETFPA
jgi:WD40 repeat protein